MAIPDFAAITCFVFDVDGVMTDGSLLVMPGGLMARRMNIKDGYALQLAIKKGYRVVVISGGHAPEVADRLAKLGVTEMHFQVKDKAAVLQRVLQIPITAPEKILYMGDDVPDLPALRLAGLPCCPADAAEEVKALSVFISQLNGGMGCVRQVIEKVLRLRGDWHDDFQIPSR
ncbi:MAG: 3-deoxy-D-manno-octulosonate 8-phosphate phosphatase [Sphingobacteriia bacterium]|nr:MAG: 3-deoxy-D-manno-octulosonate 8-phosphate phosphatase [Sphingobacteriia bacterium]